jgi:hypothetical protein
MSKFVPVSFLAIIGFACGASVDPSPESAEPVTAAILTGDELEENALVSTRCAPYPAFPDAACTGTLPGITRTASGSITTSFDGQVIENLNITGRIGVAHANVIIRNVRITNPGGVAVSNISCGSRCRYTLEDSELDGTGNTSGASALDYTSFTIRRCNIHHFGEGPGAGSNTVMEDNYLHDFTSFISQGAHQDGIQIEFGANNVIRHNRILMNVNGGNAAIVIGNQSGNQGNLVEQNLVAGGGFTLYAGGSMILRNNHISTVYYSQGGYYGPLYPGSAASRCGNRWFDGPNLGALLSGESVCVEASPAPSPLPSPAPSPTAAPSGYLGCYTDDANRALPVQLISSGATSSTCRDAAKAQGLQYAGLQNGGQCFGGNTLGYIKVSDSECGTPCSANPSEMCGGWWRNSVYTASATVADSTPPAVTITSPSNGSRVPVRSDLTISASASDNVKVDKVEFYLNGSLQCTDLTAGYSCQVRIPKARGRTHDIQAKAYDSAGNVGSSAHVFVTSY